MNKLMNEMTSISIFSSTPILDYQFATLEVECVPREHVPRNV